MNHISPYTLRAENGKIICPNCRQWILVENYNECIYCGFSQKLLNLLTQTTQRSFK